MKFLHISDLHIGKRVNGFSMIEDQKHILKQILAAAKKEEADCILIAGDIYDKAIPSAEAVQVFDWFLTCLADQERKVFAVSGNHDSAERLAFGAQLMQGRGVYVSPIYNGEVTKISLKDDYGEICIYLLPFLKPAVVRHALLKETADVPLETFQKAVALAIDHIEIDREKRNILVAHQFVTGAGRCDSEEVVVGGLDHVDADVFDAFDYVALGHIHSPQFVKRETLRYCGTPLKYSFSEVDQVKTITLAEIKGKGEIALRMLPLTPLHDMRKISGTYLEVTAKTFYQDMDTEDYVDITLTDEEDIPDGLQKLRIIYPNLMHLSYDNTRTRQNREVEAATEVELKSKLELMEEFFQLQNNQPMSQEQKEYFTALLDTIEENEIGGNG